MLHFCATAIRRAVVPVAVGGGAHEKVMNERAKGGKGGGLTDRRHLPPAIASLPRRGDVRTHPHPPHVWPCQ